MSSEPAIRVEGLGKQYRLGYRQPFRTLRDAVTEKLSRSRETVDTQTVWALKDVSFEVQKGQALGVIGHNGAGKTTLLKILSRITDPTLGQAVMHGKTGSLLEVGTGFHPELTGRENIFMNGAILGMRKKEITPNSACANKRSPASPTRSSTSPGSSSSSTRPSSATPPACTSGSPSPSPPTSTPTSSSSTKSSASATWPSSAGVWARCRSRPRRRAARCSSSATTSRP